MSNGLTSGSVLPDFELPDDGGTKRKLSELQGDDAMVLMLGRGEHCPRERMHLREMLTFHQWSGVAYTQLVSVLPNDLHDTNKMRIATGAYWPFLADADLEVQTALDIREYTDSHHAATVPHTLVLSPGLLIEKVYVGYWFWGRPTPHQLWTDLQDLFARTKPDFDPTVPAVRAEWEAANGVVSASADAMPSQDGAGRQKAAGAKAASTPKKAASKKSASAPKRKSAAKR